MNDETRLPPDAYHLIMASFPGEDSAERIVERLRTDGAFEGSEIEGEAVVSRDAGGQIHVHEKGSAGIGATFGAAAGGLIGLVTGPIGLVLMVVGGAVAGGIAGHFAGQAIPVEDLRQVGESLPPGSSAFIAVVDVAHASPLADLFTVEGARVLNVAVHTEVSSALREAVTRRVSRA
jgi:uncharacterized membrane protein